MNVCPACKREVDENPCEGCGTETIGVARKVVDNADLRHRFTYHAPKPGQPEKYTKLRDEAYGLACLIDTLVPKSREQSLAITKLEEAIFWANAGIARNQ